MWFVIYDVDGPFLTNETPAETDIVFFQGNIVEAEQQLQVAVSVWEDEGNNTNEDFQ